MTYLEKKLTLGEVISRGGVWGVGGIIKVREIYLLKLFFFAPATRHLYSETIALVN